MMTDERIEELRALCEAATPGPWAVRRFDNDGGEICWQVQQDRTPGAVLAHGSDLDNAHAKSDAHLIAAARTALPELLDEVMRLKALLEPFAAAGKLALNGQNWCLTVGSLVGAITAFERMIPDEDGAL